jgi:MbtH protein
METNERAESYTVVINDEEQYSIWPADKTPPTGWTVVGEPCSREDCLAHIKELWTDMRPRSVRERMASMTKQDS